MAPSNGPVRPARYLALFAVLVAALYALVFFTGDKIASPKLGIDLQGGTRVTLTARTPDGGAPSQTSLKQAQEIIETRVNGLGVSGSEVLVDGQNLVITVPGNDGQQARALGQTAKLYIRPVVAAQPATAAEAPSNQATPSAETPAPVPATNTSVPSEPAVEQSPVPQNRPFPAEDPVPATPSSEVAPSTVSTPNPVPGDTTSPTGASVEPVPVGEQKNLDAAAEIDQQKQLRQSTDQQIQQIALQYLAPRCNEPDPLQGNDDPSLPLVTCSADKTAVYLLEPSIIDGQEIADASSGFDSQQAQNIVSLEFKSTGSDVWGKFTAANIGKQAAFTLDSQVVSAPTVNAAILGGKTQISGSFTSSQAKDLANVLKYGSLPLSFQASEAETVSATLGLTSLRAGLIAGGIGLALVLVYALMYYRMLGVLTALSLVASGAMVFALLILLGRWIGFTLDLAGIAGLIIGIGMTADSFVVFFERIKDEMREGRSFRSAVPRGWARARKTILSGNAVSFIAAAVLYALAVGQVRGFAFTLGLTTLLDVLVVFLVTWPLVFLASKSDLLSRPSLNGLGAVQQIARERKLAATAATQKEA
ncbi:MAG: protein translocase subunit SecD [Mycobacteriaceae bacterium]